jgi:DNA-directed RNA polymerase delta subunit
MAKVSKTEVDKKLREEVFDDLFMSGGPGYEFVKINDRQYGVLLTDANGETRYIRVGAIVAELRDDMTAEELMNSEIRAYQEAQEKREQKAAERKAKAEADKARREAEKEKEE